MPTTTATTTDSPRNRGYKQLNIALWVLQWTLALFLVFAGVAKLVIPLEQVQEFIGWATELPTLFRVTSALDVLGGLGVLLPSLTRIFPRITIAAAVGIVCLMLGAVVFYISRGEPSEIVANVILALAAGVIAWGRWRRAPVSRLPEPESGVSA